MRKTFTLLVFALLLTFTPQNVKAKDYSITEANFLVQLNKDCSADITETRTYNFDGSFSWADQWIPLKAKCKGCQNYVIKDFSLNEGGNKYLESQSGNEDSYSISQSEDKFYVKWYYSTYNENKIFRLNYKIQNALTNHSDITEFYWQLIGNEWSKGTEKVTATILLPTSVPDNQIWAFGHGPLNGKVDIFSNSQVEFSATNLAAGKFFEVRVLFPKQTSATFAQNGTKNLKLILSEEKAFAFKTKFWGVFLWVVILILS